MHMHVNVYNNRAFETPYVGLGLPVVAGGAGSLSKQAFIILRIQLIARTRARAKRRVLTILGALLLCSTCVNTHL